MATFEILLTGDTFNEGRIKVNNALSGITAFWTGGTAGDGSLVSSIGFDVGAGGSAINDGAVSVGAETVASGNFSHATGFQTVAGGWASHSEGYQTTTYETGSHAGGRGAIASGTTSFCHQQQTNSKGGAYALLSTVLGGLNHLIEGGSGRNRDSIIIGGWNHEIQQSDIIGEQTSSHGSFIGGGRDNVISGSPNSSIVGSVYSNIEQRYFIGKTAVREGCSIIGASNNKIYDSWLSTIIGGFNSIGPNSFFENVISGCTSSTIIGNDSSEINNYDYSIISGGKDNFIGFSGSTHSGFGIGCGIFGGTKNRFDTYDLTSFPQLTNRSIIVGGENNGCSTYVNNSVIIGGNNNDIFPTRPDGIYADSNSVILGGENHVLNYTAGDSNGSVILGGAWNWPGLTSSGTTIMAGRGGQGSAAKDYPEFIGSYDSVVPNDFSLSNRTIKLNMETGDGNWDGSVYVGFADYAEYFEWNDGNSSNDERLGYFVSLTGNKIEISNSNIVGIISATPGIIGDNPEFRWKDSYLKDEWRRILYNTYKIYNLDIPNSGETKIYIDENDVVYLDPPNITNVSGTLYDGDTVGKTFLKDERVKIINPSYDTSQNYSPRKNRKEWSPVGLLGKLYVRTSEQITTNKVSADANGMAINGADYHVLKSIKDYDGDYGIVQILFK